MMGHSTGCQDTVRYVQRGYATDPHAAPLLGAILQAPVRPAAHCASTRLQAQPWAGGAALHVSPMQPAPDPRPRGGR
jgi:hypothetical protein